MSPKAYAYVAVAVAAVLAVTAFIAWRTPLAAAPPITLALLGGGSFALPAANTSPAGAGRPVLISFWATSCPPCVREVPMLNALHREFQSAGLDVVAVAMPYDPPANVFAFTQQHRVAYPVAFDMQSEAVRRFRVDAIPYTVLLDRAGNIAWQHLGLLNVDTARTQALRVLAQR